MRGARHDAQPSPEGRDHETCESFLAVHRDFASWIEAQVAAVRAADVAALDVDNLVEELEALTKRDDEELPARRRAGGARHAGGDWRLPVQPPFTLPEVLGEAP